MMNEQELHSATAALAAQAGYQVSAPPASMAGGRNNRVYLVETTTRRLVLKQYFQGGIERRDRMAAEFAFSRFAWEHGLRKLPEPIAADNQRHLALFAFVAGRRLRSDEVTLDRVNEALDLFSSINQHRLASDAAKLSSAAEACFTFDEHLATVEGRVDRLIDGVGSIAGDSTDRPFHEFVADRLRPAWTVAKTEAVDKANEVGSPCRAPLAAGERCLSPSDFGFHNALLGDDGRLVFCDFEYAGWDDPAKMVCDFFCQVQVPVPIEHWPGVVDRVFDSLDLSDWHRRRMALLLPVYRIKWCCILLNEYLRDGAERRQFAGGSNESTESRRRQLAAAQRYLDFWQAGESP